MAKIFLDTNVVIDIIDQRKPVDLGVLALHEVYISPLTVHIICYVLKVKLPSQALKDFLVPFRQIPTTTKLVDLALSGPTSDFEDNLQLHAAASQVCDVFVTRDTELLARKTFGSTSIIPKIDQI